MDSYLSDFSKIEQSSPAHRHSWLDGIRKGAWGRFTELGFPSTRLEDWKHTNVSPIAHVPFRLSEHRSNGLTAADLANYTFGSEECCQLVFLNGHYFPALSTLKALPRGIRVKSLSAALAADRDVLEPHLARHAEYDQN